MTPYEGTDATQGLTPFACDSVLTVGETNDVNSDLDELLDVDELEIDELLDNTDDDLDELLDTDDCEIDELLSEEVDHGDD